ncbi:MAG: CocE/NonD family hydrolase, partial [Dehalococcoidia bacterium]|nr:CocE/NonD family hydrolase [Dehalococcoidia bacterium]
FQGGAMQLALDMTWTFATDARTWHPIDNYDWKRVLSHLPLSEMAVAAGSSAARLADWIDHPDYDEYWKRIAYKERYEDVVVPVLQIGGWYDTFTVGTMNNFVGMRARGGSDLARANQKVIVGPWVHQASEHTHAGDRDFGKDSVLDLNAEHLRWFDRWLKGVENGVEDEAPIKLFVMGADEWRDEHEWPLARTRFTPFHLHSGGEANSLRGDGTLSVEAPGDEPADEYDYNPAFPVPSNGGNNCCFPEIVAWGGYDQDQIEQREDVLVYTSDELEEDLEVTGPVIAKIYASSSAPDTDFTAKLVDVHPDGYALNLCDGIIRARYRDTPERQVLMEPGKVYEFTIDLFPTSNLFRAGHRIRLEISSSNFPRFDRNLNTGGRFGHETDMRVAHQTVYHDAERPSHVLLPVIPG